jgi:hypothetical protein
MATNAPPNEELPEALMALQAFCGPDLTETIFRIEASLRNATLDTCPAALAACGTKSEVLGAAGLIKRAAAQINTVIHALGILLSLPRILRPGEVIDYVSLGAGNTGRAFDLETNQRIAEFKFIRWQGGPEVIRQNALFKDFHELAEHKTDKNRFLYVLGTEYPEKFFNGGRAIPTVLSNARFRDRFVAAHGEQYRKVRDYYLPRKHLVEIVDVSPFVPELVEAAIESEDL